MNDEKSEYGASSTSGSSGRGQLVEIEANRPVRLAPTRPLGFPSGHAKLPVIEARPYHTETPMAATPFGLRNVSPSKLREIEAYPVRIDAGATAQMVSGSSEHLPVVSADPSQLEVKKGG
jgi:hypothetical protein